MNLKILMGILIYYIMISSVLLANPKDIFNDYEIKGSLDSTALSDNEVDRGGLFGTGVSFGRFISLSTIGFGMPDTLPSWFKLGFSAWQTIFLIFTIGFIIDAIWSG